MSRSNSSLRILYRFRLTRLGLHFVFVAVFAVVGGALRGFNLLLILSGLLFAVLIVQWRQGRACIRRVRVRRNALAPIPAGSKVSMKYEVYNDGALIPVWMLRISDAITPISVPGMYEPMDGGTPPETDHLGTSPTQERALKSSLSAKQQRIRAQHWRPAPVTAGIGLIAAGMARTTEVECRFFHRGEYRLGPLEASTAYPFSLMSCERLVVRPGQEPSIYVYPQLLKLHPGWRRMLPPRRGGDGLRTAGQSGHHGEFYGVRKWQSGDHVKQVHWRTTARIGEPAVRQLERKPKHNVSVVVDLFFTTPGEFEQLLSFAMTVLDELTGFTQRDDRANSSAIHQPTDVAVADQFAGQDATGRRFFELGVSGRATDARVAKSLSQTDLLARLATANATHDPRTLPRLISENSGLLRKSDLVVLSARSMNEALRQESSSAVGTENQTTAIPENVRKEASRSRELAGFLNQRHRLTWLDLRSPAVARWIVGRRDTSGISDATVTPESELERATLSQNQ